jgi:hypothetical protein
MAAIALFVLVHVALAILVPKTITAMTRGSIPAQGSAGFLPVQAGE